MDVRAWKNPTPLSWRGRGAVEPKNPHRAVYGDMPFAVRRHGWCPECKERLDGCVCRGDAPPPGPFGEKAQVW